MTEVKEDCCKQHGSRHSFLEKEDKKQMFGFRLTFKQHSSYSLFFVPYIFLNLDNLLCTFTLKPDTLHEPEHDIIWAAVSCFAQIPMQLCPID